MNRKIKNRNNYVVIYSIVPKEYLNNSKLNSTDKLLLFHITALCHKNGYCTATNRYFMRIYGFSKTTISKSINKLIKLNILNSRIENYEFNNRKRYLTLVNNVWKNNNIGIEEANDTGVKEGFTYNNNYKYVNNELDLFINNNTIIDNEGKEISTIYLIKKYSIKIILKYN